MNPKLVQKINNYKTPNSAIDILNKTKIVLIVGVSGAGKNTVLKELLKTGKYRFIVSHTTRKPRENEGALEQDGVNYYFVDENDVLRMLNAGEFIEAKQYSGNVYGTSIAEIKKANNKNKIAISDIEVQGVAHYKEVAPNSIPIFLLPPDFETWQKRLRSRYENEAPDENDIKKRMKTAAAELKEALQKNYFEFVINDDLARAVAAVDEIAHGNLSTKKNDHAKHIAKELLNKLTA